VTKDDVAGVLQVLVELQASAARSQRRHIKALQRREVARQYFENVPIKIEC
jgi:hypothetical protein